MSHPTRRTLLGSGLVAGAALLAGCDPDDSSDERPGSTGTPNTPGTTSTPATFDPQDWASVQAQFNLDPALGQFAAFVFSPHTKVLDEAIGGYRDELATDTEVALLKGIEREAAVRAAAAAFHGGVASQYALTDSTTMGLGLMYGGLDLGPGDEVLTTTHDFYSTEESLRLLRERTGATIVRTSLYDDPARATVDEMTTRLAAAITPRTKVVALTWVHSSTGVRVPVRELSAAGLSPVPREQYLVCVDGVHGLSAVDADLSELGCDFLAAGTHKWLHGPRGTGILWGRDWRPLSEVIPTFSDPSVPAGRLTPGGYHCFEHQWAAADAFGFMNRIGRDRVVGRVVEQTTRLKEGLAELPGLTLVTPASPEVSAGIVCLDVPGQRPPDVVAKLREKGVVGSSTPYATSYVRLGPSLATNPDQVDEAIEAVSSLG
jgi:selenocysteine lyase/cysteine desulfurase